MKESRSSKVRRIGLLLMVSSVFALAGCLGVNEQVAQGSEPGSSDQTAEILSTLPEPGLVSAQQGFEILTALAEDSGFVLLDIRTAPEVETLHIPGAVNLDFYGDGFADGLAELDRGKAYLIYCRTANRTGQAYEVMHNLGFDHVWDLDGGISTWSGLGYPTCQGPLGDPHTCNGPVSSPVT